MSRIVAVRHADDGTLEAYKTDDGRVLKQGEAAKMAAEGQLEGVSAFTTRDGSQSIRSDRGQPHYSLNELPEF